MERTVRSLLTQTGLESSIPLRVIFGAMLSILLFNAVMHDPRVEYDGREHVAYIETLARGRLPDLSESREFFCPPLPYVIPAALMRAGLKPWWCFKAAQFVQFVLAAILAIYLLRICDQCWPGEIVPKLAALGMLAALPVFYKSFAMIRGEPWVACFTVVCIDCTLRWRDGVKFAILAGITGGLMILSRQWGIFALIGIVIPCAAGATRSPDRATIGRRMLVALMLASLVGGWFYLYLHQRFGSFTPFNRGETDFAMHDHPAQTLLDRDLFRDPITPKLYAEIGPIFYSETWGDYWCFFLIWGKRPGAQEFLRGNLLPREWNTPGFQTNRFSIAPYLGRVNAASLLPTACLLISAAFGVFTLLRAPLRRPATTMCIATGAVSIAGYLWFITRTPSPNYDTVKATYLLHVFPLMAILFGGMYREISRRMPAVGWVLAALLTFVALYDLPAMLTRCF